MRLIASTERVASAINRAALDTLDGSPRDLQSKRYERLQRDLQIIRSSTPEFRYLRLFGRRDDGTVFTLVDSQSSQSREDVPGAMQAGIGRAFERQEPQVLPDMSDSRGGKLVLGLAPVSNTQKAVHSFATPDDARGMVASAVQFYQERGRDALLGELNNPAGRFHKGELFAFAFDTSMRMQAIPVMKELIGRDLLNEKNWSGGWYFRREIQRQALAAGSGVVDYEYLNPVNGQREPKSTYFQRVGDLIVCSGTYKGSGTAIAVMALGVDAGAWRMTVIRGSMPVVVGTVLLLGVGFVGGMALRRVSARPKAKSGWSRHIEVMLACASGLILTATFTSLARALERENEAELFAQVAASRTDAVAKALVELGDVDLLGFANVIRSRDALTEQSFADFTDYLTHNPVAALWEWVEVTHDPAGLWEQNAKGERIPVRPRSEYYPIRYVVPASSASEVVGFDVGSEPLRRVGVEEALESGLNSSSNPLVLLLEPGQKKGMLFLRAVPRRDGSDSARSFAVAVVRMGNLLWLGKPDSSVSLQLSWLPPSGPEEVLAKSGGGDGDGSGDSFSRPVFAFGKVFVITARAGPEFIRVNAATYGWAAAGGGLALTAALAAITSTLVRRRDELEVSVQEKTLELMASEDSYREQFWINSAPMLLIDPDNGAILAANKAAEQFYGYPAGQLATLRVFDINLQPPSEVMAAMKQAETDQSGRFEFAHRLADGSVRYVEVSSTRIRMGRRVLLHSIIYDITGRKEAEAALQASEAKLRALVENSHEPIGVHVNGVWEMCNPAALRLFGFSEREEVIGKSILSVVAPSARDEIRDFVRRRAQGVVAPADYVTRGLRTDGSEFDMHVTLSEFIVNGRSHVFVIIRDVTARRQAEEALKESEERYRLLVATSPDAIFLHQDGVIVFANLAGLKLLGATRPEEIIGTPMIDRVHPDYRNLVSARIVKSLGNSSILEQLEEKFVRLDGSVIDVEVTGGSLVLSGRKTMLVIARDISARKVAEEKEQQIERKLLEGQKLESLGVMAGGIAHDFNNILTGILGNASLASLEVPSDSPVQESLTSIREASLRAGELCRQMLAYSGKGRFVVKPLDINQLVSETTDLLKISISKQVLLRFSLEEGLPAVRADATQLRQVIMNLVINASEAIGNRPGTIDVRTGRGDGSLGQEKVVQAGHLPQGPRVYIEVSDSGCGMTAETQARIFDPFFSTKFAGRGLGLAAVLGIVRGHGGVLKLVSEVGRGTTFSVILPALATQAPVPSEPDSVPKGWMGQGTVLVAEDEPSVRTSISQMLVKLGFVPVVAENGLEAVAVFGADPLRFRLVLMDLTMPELNGDDALLELKRMRPAVPVILMSGYSEQEAVATFGQSDLAGFLQKPFGFEALRALLYRVVG